MVVIHFNFKHQKLLEETMVPIDDNHLISLKKFDYCAIFCVGIITVLIFHFHEYITQYVEPDYVCGDKFVYEALTWVFPKMMRHCDAILTEKNWYTDAKIGIMWNFWIFVVYLHAAISGFRFLLAAHKKRKNQFYNFVAEHIIPLTFTSSCGFLMMILFFLYVFFGLPIPKHGIPFEWEFFRGDIYGIHAFGEAVTISCLTYMSFTRILFVLLAILGKKPQNKNY